MTRKHLNPMAQELGISLANIRASRSKKAEEGFWQAIETVVAGLKRANPNVSRERFVGAVTDTARVIERRRLEQVPQVKF